MHGTKNAEVAADVERACARDLYWILWSRHMDWVTLCEKVLAHRNNCKQPRNTVQKSQEDKVFQMKVESERKQDLRAVSHCIL